MKIKIYVDKKNPYLIKNNSQKFSFSDYWITSDKFYKSMSLNGLIVGECNWDTNKVDDGYEIMLSKIKIYDEPIKYNSKYKPKYLQMLYDIEGSNNGINSMNIKKSILLCVSSEEAVKILNRELSSVIRKKILRIMR